MRQDPAARERNIRRILALQRQLHRLCGNRIRIGKCAIGSTRGSGGGSAISGLIGAG